MTGSVKKRRNSKTWTIRYDVGRDNDGKRIQKSKGGFKTKREAENALTDILSKIQNGQFFVSSDTSYKDYLIDKWLPYSKVNVRGKTIENYEFILKSYVIPHLGSKPLNKLDVKDLELFYAKLQTDLGLSSTTTLNCHLVIHKSLKTAMKWKIINCNIADLVDKPKKAEVEMKVLEIDQVKLLLSALKGSSLYLIAVLGFITGMRRGELVGLRWKSVNLENGVIYVSEQLQKINGELVYTTPKSKKGKRNVIIPQNIIEILKKEKERQKNIRKILGNSYEDNDLIYCKDNGTPYDPDYITRHFARRMSSLSKKLNIPKIRFHDMRHSHVAILTKEGEKVIVISERLGHAKVSTTQEFYAHILPSMQQETACRLNNLNIE